MLGATLVVGINATSINMRDAADIAYQTANLYDLQLRGGFTSTEVYTIQQMQEVYHAEPANIIDAHVYARDVQRVVRTYSLPELHSGINLPTLVEGEWATEYNQIMVERRLLRESGLRLGDTITLSHPNMHMFTNMLATYEFTIVGIIESPLYLTGDRGHSTLGSVRFVAYLHHDVYITPMHTDIFVVMEGSRELHQASLEYNYAATGWQQLIEDLLYANEITAFIFTRQNGIAFESYLQDSLRLEQLGFVFPMLFFLVAVLVSLTSISRMVEEQRGQIGIYKALGYRPLAIMLKYAVYAFACGLIGGILGVILGTTVIPRIIFNAYSHMYEMPHSNHPVPWGIAAIAILIAVGFILVTAILTCWTTLKGEPATLMRPKTPKAGKRVLLERIPFIWRRMGFISKVTARNIFRYKRRFFMTVSGVAGCTALLLVAFGLRDSIGSVARIQFEEISVFDFQVHLRDTTPEQRLELFDLAGLCISANMAIHPAALLSARSLFIRTMTADAHTYAGGFSATVIIPENFDELPNFMRMIEPTWGFNFSGLFRSSSGRTQNNVIPYGEGVFVTEKLAREMNIQVGDYFNLTLSSGVSYRIRAAGIVENYVLHYIHIPPEYYSRIFGHEFVPNGMFILGDYFVLESMRQHENVLAITDTAAMRDSLSNQTDALGVVTWVILFMACTLAFVVLFNLTEINIIERMRELATIKVLGFFDMETAMYLYRENMVVTCIGIMLGLFGGVFLNQYVLTTVEIDLLKFPHIILPSSFALATGLSVLFALCVNIATYRRITSIDMVMALKSVE